MRLFIQHPESPSITVVEDVHLDRPIAEIVVVDDHECIWIEGTVEPIDVHLTLREIGIEQDQQIVHGHRNRCRNVNVEVTYVGMMKKTIVPPNSSLQVLLEWAVREFSIDSSSAVDMVFRAVGSPVDLDPSVDVGTLVGKTGCEVRLELIPGETHAGFHHQ